MILICVIEMGLMLLYGCITYKMKKTRNKLENIHPQYNKEEFQQWVKEIVNKENFLTTRYGKTYAYNPRKKEILFTEKEKYSLYDIFAIYHELGHYHDDLKSNIVLKHMSITCINRLVLIPIFIILTLVCWFMDENERFMYVYLMIAVLCIFLGLHRLYFICKYEVSASRDAFINMSKSYDMLDLDAIKNIAYNAVLSQGVFVLVYIIFGLVIVDAAFYL